MKIHHFAVATSAAVLMAAITPAFAAEGAATGNGTSTAAGPAGDNQGPSKSGGSSMMPKHSKKMKHHKSM